MDDTQKPKFLFYDGKLRRRFMSNRYVLKRRGVRRYAVTLDSLGKERWKRIKNETYDKLYAIEEGRKIMDPQKIIKNILGVERPRVGVGVGVERPRVGVGIGRYRNLTTKQYKAKFGPKGDIDGDGVPNWKDCRPLDRTRDMVHYGYYKVTHEDGGQELVYAGSKSGVRSMGALQKPPVQYIKVEEMTYAQALAERGEQGLAVSRARSSGYTSAGKHAGKAAIKDPTAPY